MARPKPDKLLKPGVTPVRTPGFLIRLAAICYDLLLLVAILFFATAILLPLNSGEATSPAQVVYYRIYLLLVSFGFYGWFWTHGGQTLGLKAWKLKVLTDQQQPLTWRQALVRFLAAGFSWGIFGIGFLWLLFDKDNRSWYDRFSKTAVFFDSSSSR